MRMCFNIAVGSDSYGKYLLCLISGDSLSVTTQEFLMSLNEGVCLIHDSGWIKKAACFWGNLKWKLRK